MSATRLPLSALYEKDETAWLGAMSALAAEKRFAEMDFGNLGSYLKRMANCDRREVEGRLVDLLADLLRWEHLADKRSGEWRGMIMRQRRELCSDCRSETLRAHAETVWPEACSQAQGRVTAETGLPVSTVATALPHNLSALLVNRATTHSCGSVL